jgi:hypothetical protein
MGDPGSVPGEITLWSLCAVMTTNRGHENETAEDDDSFQDPVRR